MYRTVFYISDGTAITAETLGHSLLTQFDGLRLRQVRIPFVDSEDKAIQAKDRIDRAAGEDGLAPIVFNTIVEPRLVEILETSQGHKMDLFGAFLAALEQALGVKRSPHVGRAHGIQDPVSYEHRIEATNYALDHDDGIDIRFDDAEVILVGVSRVGKTPTCLYMALHYGVRAANYPLTEDDMENLRLPSFLRKHKSKLYGLEISAERLAQIRETRRPGSRYASLKQCRRELEMARSLLQMENVPLINTTTASVEEIGSHILDHLGLQRELF